MWMVALLLIMGGLIYAYRYELGNLQRAPRWRWRQTLRVVPAQLARGLRWGALVVVRSLLWVGGSLSFYFGTAFLAINMISLTIQAYLLCFACIYLGTLPQWGGWLRSRDSE
jgi:hypothetical protein